MDVIAYLKENYNVEFTVEEDKTRHSKTRMGSICVDITSHFEELPPFVKSVKVCAEGFLLELDETDAEYEADLELIDERMEKLVQRCEEQSFILDTDGMETVVLICEGGYVMKVSGTEFSSLLIKKGEEADQAFRSIDDDRWELKKAKK